MKTGNSQDGSSRVEREILEILERVDAAPTPIEQIQASVRRQRLTARAQLWRAKPSAWSPEILKIVGALLLAIAAAAIADVSRFVAVTLAIASGIALLSLWFPGGRPGPGDSPRWRGRDLHDPTGPPFGSRDPRFWRDRQRPSR
jgi:hypothetical protein